MKKQTNYILYPPGYNIPIAHCKTMRQVKRVLRKNKNLWIDVHKFIRTKSRFHGCWARFHRYLGESHEIK